MPILYLRSTKDRVVPGSRAEEIRRERPDVRIADIEGPHLALVTNPAAAWAAIEAFVVPTATAVGA